MAERGRLLRRLALGASILLFASLLQFHQLTRDLRFLPDEAYFMTFARHAAVQGDWLLPGALDKPPLSLYLSAVSMAASGNRADADGVLHLDPRLGEFAGALPNVMLAIMHTALTMRLAWRLFRDLPTSLFAGLLTAASPFMLTFGASAYTDMGLLLFSTAAFFFALSRRWALAGLALGVAFWSKQQAVFVAPLLVALMMRGSCNRAVYLRFLIPLGIVCSALLLWDASRPETSIFLLAAANNAPADIFAHPVTWLARALTWLQFSGWLLGPPAVTGALVAFSAFSARARRPRLPLSARLRVLLFTVVIYSFAHVVFNFNLYDRYVLLMLPLLTLLVAGGVAEFSRAFACYRASVIIVGLIVLGGIWTLNGESPIGGDRTEYADIDALAAHLNSKPVATVIYDPWLGWQLGYYLGSWHDKRRVHYPTADALVEGALALDETGHRYLVAPIDQPLESWLAALRDVGFSLSVDYQSERFVVYRLKPPV